VQEETPKEKWSREAERKYRQTSWKMEGPFVRRTLTLNFALLQTGSTCM
jgi:hypothetical protein